MLFLPILYEFVDTPYKAYMYSILGATFPNNIFLSRKEKNSKNFKMKFEFCLSCKIIRYMYPQTAYNIIFTFSEFLIF